MTLAPRSPAQLRTLLFGFFTLFSLLLLLKNPEIASTSVQKGITLCVRTVIPSLFPFAILSELLRASPLLRRLLSPLSRPLCRLLRISASAADALLLGLLCGAPVGAQGLVRALDAGAAEREECERLLGIATVPSSAFLIGAVGESLFESAAYGRLLFFCVLLASFLTALLFARSGGVQKKEAHALPAPSPVSLPDAVRVSVSTLGTVCAFVLFFSVLSGALESIPLPLPDTLRAALSSLLELTEGSRRAASLAQRMPAACLSAFAAGWSGLSVHCQILSVCEGRGLSFGRYFLCKLSEGLLCALLVCLSLSLFPSLL